MLNYLTHASLQTICRISANRFYNTRHLLEEVQRQKLSRLLARVGKATGKLPTSPNRQMSWEAFSDTFPVTRYGEWKKAIHAQRTADTPLIDSPLVRYQPTSGSSEKLKYIPYTKLFLQELNAAITPWIDSLYRHYPAIKKGTQYWSVSWLPQNQHKAFRENLNDDSQLLGGLKQLVTSRLMAVPSNVALAASPEDSLFATLCYLVATSDLTVMSVWSPTFALQLLDNLPRWAHDIAAVLTYSNWGKREASLGLLKPPHAPQRASLLLASLEKSPQQLVSTLWPAMSLISGWDTADSQSWATQLAGRIPQAAFEGKGLWATEGVVSIPVDGHYPLAFHSHVYEFELLDSGKIVPPWQLREGDEVSPILSTGNGLLRYALDDRVVVSEFWGKVPCFRFLGRKHGVDLVGEKISPLTASQTLNRVAQQFGLKPITLMALNSQHPGQSCYMAIFEHADANPKKPVSPQLGTYVEKALLDNFHYALARDLNQLSPAKALITADGWSLNKRINMANGMIEGNIKPEPIRKVPLAVFTRLVNTPGMTA